MPYEHVVNELVQACNVTLEREMSAYRFIGKTLVQITSDQEIAEINEADPVSVGLYNDAELGELPVAAALASLGCGNPTALAALNAGERVLDLGSGGGIDVLLSA